ncbi:D-alanyl-D-alanine carboxypeptidase family protein [Sutterella sp.]|uniref:D-alanyl-D-alanine carboxypeptidase family protein n=1 Tax=Sutterella sp. TaxID=1981025 RepID=UPI0026E10FE9|nr:serine hydrolase [Sutterella sp.]MDO5531321.1 serine hydrolase [Sutterella sp.]
MAFFRLQKLAFSIAAACLAAGSTHALAADAAQSKAAVIKTAAAPAKQGAVKKLGAGSKSAKAVKTSLQKPQKKAVKKVAKRKVRRTAPSQATLAGLRNTEDPLLLGSSVAYAIDQDTGEELVAKNADVQLPIASVTKLMTALVIAESDLPLNEKIRITREDHVRSTARSKLWNGMRVTREALLKAALMSSDNRAAHALARTYPGGKKAFIAKMNERAAELGMTDSVFADPTGLDNRNNATAKDLARLVAAVYQHQEIREASTQSIARISTGKRSVKLVTTNRLIGDPSWRIGIQKTGFTTAAGRCMVVQSDIGDRRLVMVVLDSPTSAVRANDMRTMRAYVAAEERFNKEFASVTPYEIF